MEAIYSQFIDDHYKYIEERRKEDLEVYREAEIELPEGVLYITYFIGDDRNCAFIVEGTKFGVLKEGIFSEKFCECCTTREQVHWKVGRSTEFVDDEYEPKDGDVFTLYLNKSNNFKLYVDK